MSSATLDQRPEAVAADMSIRLGFDLSARDACSSWEEALRLFVGQAERLGVMVMVSGIVLSNTHRTLDLLEFRGFALADRRAPLVFINGADRNPGRCSRSPRAGASVARRLCSFRCKRGASPRLSARGSLVQHRRGRAARSTSSVSTTVQRGEPLDAAMRRLARQFKVSTLVILRRLLDAGAITRDTFGAGWVSERERLRALADAGGSGGGDFYRTTLSRVGKRFARALVESTLEGQPLCRDAFRMLGVQKAETFNTLGREVGVIL